MPEHDAEARSPAWLAILLAWVAGTVDAIGYLLLAHLFTAHMSGNTAALGAHLGAGDLAVALHRFLPVPFFVLGIALGAALAEGLCRRELRSPFAAVLGLQALMLLLLALFGAALTRGASPPTGSGAVVHAPSWRYVLAVVLPSAAMGIQNATLRRVGRRNVRTTYVSGMLTNMAEQIVYHLYWLGDRARGRPVGDPPLPQAGLYGGIWLGFLFGAVVGGLTAVRWSFHALALSLGGLAIVIVRDLVAPITGATGEPSCR